MKNFADFEKIKNVVSKNYKNIMNSFKILASNSGLVDSSFSVGINLMTDWFMTKGIIDRKLIHLKDFDINFIAVNK